MQHRSRSDQTVSAIDPVPGSASTRSAPTSSSSDPAVRVGAIEELLDARVIMMTGISSSGQDQFSPAIHSSRPEREHRTQLGLALLLRRPLGGITHAKTLV